MRNTSRARLTRLAIGAVAATALVGCFAGCTATPDGSNGATTDAATGATGTPYVPEVTDGGSVIISNVTDCAQIGGYLGSIIDGLEISLEAVDPASVFCDWGGQTEETPIVSVEITGDGSVPVPTADVVTASGGQVIDSAAATAKGGIVYSLPGTDGQAFALMAVLPDVSVSATAVGMEIGDDQVRQLAGAVEEILRLSDQ